MAIFLILLSAFSMQSAQHRQLLIFGEDEGKTRKQLDLFSPHDKEVAERDLIIAVITDKNDKRIDAFDIDRKTWTLILVGKDGGEKFRSGAPVSPDLIFGLIDSMPMRKREMEQRNHK